MKRSEFLLKAETYINGKRAEDYGDVKVNHQQIADIWSVILGTKVTTDQVLKCMIGVKLSRLNKTPDHEDSIVDICAYAALLGEVVTTE